MQKSSKHYTLDIKLISIEDNSGKNSKTLPLMDISIFGVPSLPEILRMMREIKQEIKQLEGDYISVTDLTQLKISTFLSKIILRGMESTYKSAIGVGRPAILSFVILKDSQEYASVLSNSLQNINNQKIDNLKDYKYRYYFVKGMAEVQSIAKKLLL